MVMRDSEKYTEKPNEITICHSFEEYLGALDKYWKYREEMFKKRKLHISRFKYVGQPDCTGQEHYLFEYNIIGADNLIEVAKKKEIFGVIKSIIDNVVENYGKQTKSGKLIGIQITEEDVYYILDDHGTYNFASCVGDIPE